MPNRILKESIRLNRKIDQLSDFQENMFYRLIVSVDDYGIYFADPAVLASTLYPRKRSLNPDTVSRALKRMKEVGLIRLYQSEGETYLKILSWERHQRMRASVHRYPVPEEGSAEEGGEEAGNPAAEDPAEKASDPAEEGKPGEAGVRELPVVELPLNDNSTFGVTRSDISAYAALYPAVDIEQELRNMLGWCMANPLKRKTRNGIKRFIAGWLARVQDKGGGIASARLPPENPFIPMAMGGPVRDGSRPNPFAGLDTEGRRGG